MSNSRQIVALGARLELQAAVAGSAPTSFRWSRNGVPLANASSANLVVAASSASDNGWYRVTATDSTGSTDNAVIFVNVVVPSARIGEAGVSGSAPPTAPAGTRALVAVAAGRAHGLALQGDGTVLAWGSDTQGESSVPAGLSEVVAVAASESQSVALRADGRVIAWGSNTNGETAVPAGLSNVVAIAAGGRHALALRSDGRVVAWGRSTDGETAVPFTLANVVAIAAGPQLSLALDANGAVFGWGANPAVPVTAGPGPFVGVAAGSFYGVARRANGTVVCWPDITVRFGHPTPSNLTGVADVAVAGNVGVVARTDGTVTGWSATGVTVPFSGGVITNPFPPENLLPDGLAVAPLISIAAGQGHVVLLRDGSRDLPPAIQTQPTNGTANAGGTFVMSVTVGSAIPVRYQWQRNGVPLPGATMPWLSLQNITPAQAGTYSVTVTSEFGSVTSTPAALTVFPLATVAPNSPSRQAVRLGGRFSLGVTVTGSETARIQWRRNGLAVAGATSATYAVEQATRADAGWYQAEVVNAAGPTYSPPLFVVVALEQARLAAWGDAAALGLPATMTDVAGVLYDRTMGAHILRSDGTVTAFGGIATPDLADIVQLIGATAGRAALQSDGAVTHWRQGSVASLIERRAVQISLEGSTLSMVRADGSATNYEYSTRRFSAEGSNVALASSTGLLLRRNGTLEAVDSDFKTRFRYALSVPAEDLVQIATDSSVGPVALTNDGRLLLLSPTVISERIVARLPGGGSGLAVLPQLASPNLVLNRDGTLIANPPVAASPSNLSRVVFSAGTPDSGIAVIDASADTAPAFVTPPASATVGSGGAVTLAGAVAGTGTGVSYQWFLNGSPLPNATLPTLALRGVTSANAGRYTLSVTNARGSATSAAATLTIVPTSNPGRLTNLSVRAAAGAGAQTLIVGFVVGGSPTLPAKPLLLRAIGPTLQSFGVRGVLENPLLQVYAGDTVFTSNDDWQGNQGDLACAYFGGQVGAFPLPDSFSFDSALVTQVRPGAYSMQITAASGANGVALAEVYDIPQGTIIDPTSPARLVNLSTRANAGSGDTTLIVGFAITGDSPRSLLLRAVGPGLTQFGVGGTMSDPQLQLFSGTTVINANDNWNGDSAITAAAARVGAFALNPAARDAALLVSLGAGAYTAQVSGVGAASGVVLVEIYEVP